MTTQSDHAADVRAGRPGRRRVPPTLVLGLIGLALAVPFGARAAVNVLLDQALSDARRGVSSPDARRRIATAVRWGADPNRRPQYGPSAILIACQQGDAPLARLLL